MSVLKNLHLWLISRTKEPHNDSLPMTWGFFPLSFICCRLWQNPLFVGLSYIWHPIFPLLSLTVQYSVPCHADIYALFSEAVFPSTGVLGDPMSVAGSTERYQEWWLTNPLPSGQEGRTSLLILPWSSCFTRSSSRHQLARAPSSHLQATTTILCIKLYIVAVNQVYWFRVWEMWPVRMFVTSSLPVSGPTHGGSWPELIWSTWRWKAEPVLFWENKKYNYFSILFYFIY